MIEAADSTALAMHENVLLSVETEREEKTQLKKCDFDAGCARYLVLALNRSATNTVLISSPGSL